MLKSSPKEISRLFLLLLPPLPHPRENGRGGDSGTAAELQMEGWRAIQACEMGGSPSSQYLASENVPVIARTIKCS